VHGTVGAGQHLTYFLDEYKELVSKCAKLIFVDFFGEGME